jgi:hypothetical protein
LYFQRISLDDVRNPLPGLLGSVGIKLNSVPKHLGTAGDNVKRHGIPNARVDCGRRLVRKPEELSNPLGF